MFSNRFISSLLPLLRIFVTNKWYRISARLIIMKNMNKKSHKMCTLNVVHETATQLIQSLRKNQPFL